MITNDKQSIRYMAPLDGIRAIAILAVLAFHISPGSLSGGFMGVDVFFVLSGFLITSIITHNIDQRSFTFREFYLRRVQRLLPNAILMIMVVILLWKFYLPPLTARTTGSHGLWTLFNASNIFVWKNLGGYWSNSAEWAPLTHTWSLGIEEQFYLIFPFILLLLLQRMRNEAALILTVAASLSFALCLYGSYTSPAATFYLLPTRIWELLLGALVATLRTQHDRTKKLTTLLPSQIISQAGWIGMAMIIVCFFIVDENSVFPGFLSLLPTVGTALLLLSVVSGETFLSRWLSSRFMVGVGKRSYSLYLWHWPLITFGKIQAATHGWPKIDGALTGGIVGVLLACCAYVYVEQPLRENGYNRFKRITIILLGFVGVLTFSAILAFQQPVADKNHLFETPSFSIGLYDAGNNCGTPLQNNLYPSFYDVYLPRASPSSIDSWKSGGIQHLYKGNQPKVVVLGSSHGLMYSKLIDGLCKEMKLSVAFLSIGHGTPAFFETKSNPNFSSETEAREFDAARKQFIREWQPDIVFVIDRWDSLYQTDLAFEEKFRAFLDEVSPYSGRVVFVAQVPVLEVGNENNLREIITRSIGKTGVLPTIKPDFRDMLRRNIAAKAEMLAHDFSNVRILRADLPFYAKNGSVQFADGRKFYYIDDNHLSDSGSEVVRDLFQEAITEAVQTRQIQKP